MASGETRHLTTLKHRVALSTIQLCTLMQESDMRAAVADPAKMSFFTFIFIINSGKGSFEHTLSCPSLPFTPAWKPQQEYS